MYASEVKNPKKVTYSINEYEHFKKMKSKTDDALLISGLNKEQIKELKTSDYKNELKKRAKLDDATLKAMGYTDEKISLLRNYDGSEVQTLAASATVYVGVYLTKYHYLQSTDKTYVGFAGNMDEFPYPPNPLHWYLSLGTNQ